MIYHPFRLTHIGAIQGGKDVIFGSYQVRLAVGVRRLHDTARSGWWILLAFVPVASIVLLVFMCLDSEPRPNAYGPSPKHAPGGYEAAGGYTHSPSGSAV